MSQPRAARWIGWLLIIGVSMYFFSGAWEVLIAVMLSLCLVLFFLFLLGLVAKSLGIAALEFAILRKIFHKKKV